jgi:Putative Ig domain
VKILLAAAAAVCLAVVVPSAGATPPDVAGNPSLWLLGGPQPVQIPPAQPKIGDTIESTWAVFYCQPACDPNSPDADPNVGKRIIYPSDSGPPAGFKMAWERCQTDKGTGCVVVRDRQQQGTPGADHYAVTDADAGQYIRSAVYGTNLDCGEVVREGPNKGQQECRWETRGVYSALVPIPRTIVVLPATMPDGKAGVAYSVPITATNGAGNYAYGVTGTLPPGLAFTGGAVQGTPTMAGTYTFTIQAGGAGANPGSRTYTMKIALNLPQASLAAGTTGVAYNQALSVVGAAGPVTWTVASGALPPGLAITNAALTGTPTQKGTFAFTLQAADPASSSTATNAYTVDVGSPTLHAVNAKLPRAKRGSRYRARLLIDGGAAPYTVVLTAGRLPRGLTLGADGTVSGIPREKTKKTVFRFVVTANDKYEARTPMLFSLPYAGAAR